MKINKSEPKTRPPSFFALISDIHANIDALDAVLTDIAQWPCRGILCLGDIVGYGPEPAACVQRVMDTCAVSVFGNPLDKPVHLDEYDRYAINVGSVGQPRDDDPRACYALYDYQNRLLLHRRVEYDIARAQARFKKSNLPARNASRLKKGQ